MTKGQIAVSERRLFLWLRRSGNHAFRITSPRVPGTILGVVIIPMHGSDDDKREAGGDLHLAVRGGPIVQAHTDISYSTSSRYQGSNNVPVPVCTYTTRCVLPRNYIPVQESIMLDSSSILLEGIIYQKNDLYM